MVKYVKKNGIKKPIWVDPLFPAFRGLLDAVLQKVKAAAEEKAVEIENKMLQQIALTTNEVEEAYGKINIMVARFCKGTSFRVIAEEIPELTPHVFDAQAITHRYGLHQGGGAAA